jgi:cytochrome c556
MKNKLVSGGVGLAIGLSVSAGAFAQAKPDVLVKQRQSAMTLVGKYAGPMFGMAQGKVPWNAEVIARNAGYLDALAKMPWDGFTEATKDIKSAALPAVYTDGAKFKQAGDDMNAAIAQLVTASKGTDEGAIKTAIGNMGKTCAGCHDNFRQKQ